MHKTHKRLHLIKTKFLRANQQLVTQTVYSLNYTWVAAIAHSHHQQRRNVLHHHRKTRQAAKLHSRDEYIVYIYY